MDKNNRQLKEPFLEACIEYMNSNPTPFDVPGHKMGRLTTDLTKYAGENIFKADFNAPLGLDNLYHPHGVIKEAEELAAEAFHADRAIFSVNGTTGGILTILISLLRAKDKIILPRNVHKSVINGLIISGAYPIFVEPDVDNITGIANGVSVETYIKAMDENPDSKALFVINPTYFGIASNLVEIVNQAHKRGILVICDEAHGAHFVFNKKMPISAMDAGADISTMSVHKTAGSLTQSSLILIKKERIDVSRVEKVFAMFSSTSPNHILMASLDAARKMLYFEGEKLIDYALELANYARSKINKLPGLYAFDKEYCTNDARFNFDETKLVINTYGLGISGFEVLKELRQKFNIQLELAEVSEVLAIVGIGSKKEDIDKLIEGLTYLSNTYYKEDGQLNIPHFDYTYPKLIVRPREAFNAPSKIVPIEDAAGEISSEAIMIYPPGIPIAIPGEIISKQAIELVEFYENNGGVLLSDSPDGYIKVIDQSNWFKNVDLDIE